MVRDLSQVDGKEFDLIVVGGGMYGVCAAWDAARRGLRVVLLERRDYCSGTSANHFKVVHGGIRYLQHLDFKRVRESSRERNILLRIAPHLVRPLPFVMPTYGHGMKGKEILRAGLSLYDLLTFDRNTGIDDPEGIIPRSGVLSRDEVIELFPGVEQKGLTGGAIFYDGQMYNPPRLALSFLRSAVQEGAVAANYTEVTGFLQRGNRIRGVKARDLMSGRRIEVRSKVVLNTAGPWAHHLLQTGLHLDVVPRPVFSRDLALVVSRKPTTKYGVAYTTVTVDVDSVLDRGGRHLFAVPWRDVTLVGVWHKVFAGPPDQIKATEDELQVFLDEINTANPDIGLVLDDIELVNMGLTLFGEESRQGLNKMSFGKRSLLIEHQHTHNVEGLITLIGVRATTAQAMAEQAVDLVCKKIGQGLAGRGANLKQIFGGQIGNLASHRQEAVAQYGTTLGNDVTNALVRNYGSEFEGIIKYANEDTSLADTLGSSPVLKAEVIHAIREEAAQKLVDVVFRRTDLGTAGNPGDQVIRLCAELMAEELNWTADRTREEVAAVMSCFPPINRKL